MPESTKEEDKREPILIMVPPSFKDREFKLAYNEALEGLKQAIFMDLEAIQHTQSPIWRGLQASLDDKLVEEYKDPITKADPV